MRRNLRTTGLAILVLMLVLQTAWGGVAHAEDAQSESTDVTFSLSLPAEEKALLDSLLQIKKWIEQIHPTGAPTKALYEGMIRGLLDSLGDPYSSYLSPDELSAFTTSLSDSYSGIGVVLSEADGEVTIVSVMEGSPAASAGVEPGDVVLSVDGMEYASMADVSGALRGDAGTGVILMVTRPSENAILSFGLMRAVIVLDRIAAEDLGDGLHYLKITRFSDGVASRFAAEMERIKAAGGKGLVLDLRGNPGGLLTAGLEVARCLIPKGPVVTLDGKLGQQTFMNDSDIQPIPIVVLVNGGTASSSEIVAGAVRDTDVGRLVGEKTYGKGCVQQVARLGDDLGGIRLTIANYLTPTGRSIGGIGLEPDVALQPVQVDAPLRIEYRRDMRKGLIGLDVLALQENLNFLGYSAGLADGIFGSVTGEAVARFFADRKVAYHGLVGSAEVDLINKASDDKATNPPDNVMQKGIEILRTRVATGTWTY